jgi:N-acetylglucosamine kinase-like BadF-type ATPase
VGSTDDLGKDVAEETDQTRMKDSRKILLGVDIGGTKTRALLADEHGAVQGVGLAGPGNHETVGYDGLTVALRTALDKACAQAKVVPSEILAAGFGIGGLDWDSEEADTRRAIEAAGVRCPMRLVNDAIIGLVAGTPEGWGIGVVSGTGCNCWGWSRDRSRIGRVTGGGIYMGEGAGATELMFEAVRAVARSWTKRGPETALADSFVACSGAKDLPDLLSGLMDGRYELDACSAPSVFENALEGDPVAAGLVEWAGTELGEMVNAVVRQLDFGELSFDVVMIGSMFDGGPMLLDAMQRKVRTNAPHARFTRLNCPPVVGAALLAMEQAGLPVSEAVRERLARETIARL